MTCTCGHDKAEHYEAELESEHAGCTVCNCRSFTAGPVSAEVREASPAEATLIFRLSQSVGYRLLREWDELPAQAKAMPMNRAFLSALALGLGTYLAATALNEPANLEGWNFLVAQTLEIVRETAVSKRAEALGIGQVDLARRVLMPGPKTVM